MRHNHIARLAELSAKESTSALTPDETAELERLHQQHRQAFPHLHQPKPEEEYDGITVHNEPPCCPECGGEIWNDTLRDSETLEYSCYDCDWNEWIPIVRIEITLAPTENSQ